MHKRETTSQRESYDVMVIGGGPAGTAAAALLERHGHTTLVCERSEFPRYHVGESLIPHTQRGTLMDCLVGDVIDKDMSRFLQALAAMTPPPEPL